MQQQSETHRNTLQHTATQCNTLEHIATHFNTLQHTATQLFCGTSIVLSLNLLITTNCNKLQQSRQCTIDFAEDSCRRSRCELQHTATLCNKLQYTAIHCTTSML